MILVGNKSDLSQTDRKVTLQQAQKFAKEEKLMFIETSAINNKNVDEAFQILIWELHNR